MERGAKSLSDMYTGILVGLGVPETVLSKYIRNARSIEHQKHTSLRGVVDPTSLLPEGHIFIPGFKDDGTGKRELFTKDLRKIFVTRSPCVEPTDAKMWPVVNIKPKRMPAETWEWLCGFKFGHIIFYCYLCLIKISIKEKLFACTCAQNCSHTALILVEKLRRIVH